MDPSLQLELPLARRRDPATSHAAAAKASGFKARHIAKIYDALVQYGPMNYREIARVTMLEAVAVNRRAKEMVESKLVTIGPEIVDGCRVWRPT